MTTPPTSTYYCKAFCVKCLTDRNRTGGVWRNRMFFCGAERAVDPTLPLPSV